MDPTNLASAARQGVDHSRPKAISRHTPTDQMPRFKAVVRFQASCLNAVRADPGWEFCACQLVVLPPPPIACRQPAVNGPVVTKAKGASALHLLPAQSHEEACRAVREKYGGFICQLPVTLRVLP